MNSKRKGAIGVAKAIAYYTEQGKAVFVPVSDVSRYDLIVDDNGELLRVEVKTTTSKYNDISLRTKGGNKTGTSEKRISGKDCDLIFCVNLTNGVVKEFKAFDLEGRTTVRLKDE